MSVASPVAAVLRVVWPALPFVVAVGACENEAPLGTGGAGGVDSVSSSQSSASGIAASVGPGGGSLPAMFMVSGLVTDGQTPLEGATVKQGGGEPLFVTGPDGTFTIEMSLSIPGTPTLVAGKAGYRTAGVEITDLAEGPFTLALKAISAPDNALGYVFMPPGTGDPQKDNSTAVCGHCHSTLVAQFLTSAHARATRDPLVWDLYAGTSSAYTDAASCVSAGGEWRDGLLPGSGSTTSPRCYLGGGVLPDLNGCGKPGALSCDDPALPALQKPQQFGSCADCHAAGLDGQLGGRNLLEATGLSFDDGNHCDVCHKVRDIDLQKPPGTAGRLVFQRPNETQLSPSGPKPVQVMYGPFLDVPNEFMGGSEAPIFKESTFCAGCHEQTQASLLPGGTLDPRFVSGVPIHSTFGEWQASPWAMAGATCQHCHMPKIDGLYNSLDVTEPEKAGLVNGFVRPLERNRSHAFLGPLAGTPRLLDSALGFWLEAKPNATTIDVTVVLTNQGCGHALPTGEPMRSILLSVSAKACGTFLTSVNSPTLPDVAGFYAQGIVGQEITFGVQTASWADGAQIAKPGQVLRVVRDTGNWEDDPGFGYFGDPARTPPEKGIPARSFVGASKILSVAAGTIALESPLVTLPGDLVFLGETQQVFVDGGPSQALAGSAGKAFAKVLVDETGKRQSMQHRAFGLASDNRLLPFQPVNATFTFGLPAGCTSATVEAVTLYRPVPMQVGRERGVLARDFVVARRVEMVALP